MSRPVRLSVAAVLVALVVAAAVTGWPFGHTFATYTWPGLFGWVAHNCPGNVVAGFLQVGAGFLLGVCAHRVGLFDRAKQWATRDLHARLAEHEAQVKALHAKVDGIHRHIKKQGAAP
jgi:hypothetical protein